MMCPVWFTCDRATDTTQATGGGPPRGSHGHDTYEECSHDVSVVA